MSQDAPSPPISHASLPDPGLWTDPARYRRQLDRVLARSWQVVAGVEEVAEPGSVRPVTLLPGGLDEPLVLVRDAGGTLRALSNACTHRGALVAERPCRADALRCPYHGRRFRLDGRLLAAPEFDGAEAFPGPGDDLPAVAVGTWGPLVLVSLDPAMPLAEVTAEAERRMGFVPWSELRRDPDGDATYEVEAHWLLWCENYLEGLHVPFVHPALARALDWRAYRTEVDAWGSTQVGIAPEGGPVLPLPPGHPDAGGRVGALYVQLFPTTLLNLYPWGLSLNTVEPLGPARTRVRYRRWVWRPELRERGAGAGLETVEAEDDAIVESVQRGVRSRLYRPGRYAPRWEAAVHHLHRQVERLGG